MLKFQMMMLILALLKVMMNKKQQIKIKNHDKLDFNLTLNFLSNLIMTMIMKIGIVIELIHLLINQI